MKPRHVAGFAALQMIIAASQFYRCGHWGYIPTMVSMTLFCVYCAYMVFARELCYRLR